MKLAEGVGGKPLCVLPGGCEGFSDLDLERRAVAPRR